MPARKKHFIIILFVLFLLCPFYINAQDVPPKSLQVKGLWYSKFPFFRDEDIRIYVIIQNDLKYDVRGMAQFFDNEDFVGEINFTVVSGRLIETWVDWKPSAGDHTITTKLTQITKHEVGEIAEPIAIQTEIFESNVFVDTDTDSDGIGNTNDLDDDNDGVSDAIEETNGTNPLLEDTNNDGISDAEEIKKTLAVPQETTAQAPKDDVIAKEPSGLIEKSETAVKNIFDKADKAKDAIKLEREKIQKEIIQDKIDEAASSSAEKNTLLRVLKQIYGVLLTIAIAILHVWPLILLTIIAGIIYFILRKKKKYINPHK